MRKDKGIKLTGIVLGELFAIGTIIVLFATNQYGRLPLAFGTLLLVLLPAAMERIFQCRFFLPVYIFALLYAVGPMLGHCWNFYYTISWWDKLLHFSGGVMFAIVGAYFFELLTKRRDNFWAGAIFALCFSMALSVLWEFIEFGADRLLGMDTQDDVVITNLTSYFLGDGLGVAGSIENIQSVVVNGVTLPVNGYIDIGLTDTMLDMMLESLGALITCLLLLVDQGRHPLIQDGGMAISNRCLQYKREAEKKVGTE